MENHKKFWTVGKILIAALLLLVCMVQAFAQNIKTYKVKRNETTESVAKKFNLTEAELLDANKSFIGVTLKKGDILLIPIYDKNTPKPLPEEKPVIYSDGKTTQIDFSNAQFIEHTVLPKETKYGISRQYGITQDDLTRCNPYLEASGVQVGQILKIPVLTTEQKQISNQNIAITENINPLNTPYIEHVVQPKETKYGISRQYGITEEQLCAMNPVLRTSDPKIGQVLKIMQKTKTKQVTEVTDTAVVTPTKPQGKYAHGKTLNVDIMLPFYVNKVDSLVFLPEKERLKDSKTAISFYMGVRMALDSLGRDGMKINARVFDTQRSTQAVDNVFSANTFDSTNVVIGPLFAEIAEYVCTKMSNTNALVVSPFSVRHNVGALPNIIQASASADIMQENLMDYVVTTVKNNTKIVILAPADKMISQVEYIKNRAISKVGTANVLVLDTENEQTPSLLAEKVSSEACVIITPSLGAPIMNIINSAISSTVGSNAPITVYAVEVDARGKKMMSENSGMASSRMSFVYASRYFEDKNKADYRDFAYGFARRYHEQPNMYAVEAFDLTYDMLLRLASSQSGAADVLTGTSSDSIGNIYQYTKHEAGGYENTHVYILSYRKVEGENLLK
ncbi:MAG: LysM peptidoglycan-binding domain-containing protein [Flavobacteriales bacterium]|nr:LysM peptidoglycan-binding domain-containing protein [Flavobacteriales bacterium]